jgi:hypothetical protein
VLYWADTRWIGWNHERLGEHTGSPRGAFKICRFAEVQDQPNLFPALQARWDIKVLPFTKEDLSDDPTRLSGFCSGGAAISLAHLFGAARIVLLFFDMTPGNFHDRHKRGTDDKRYQTTFMPAIARMAQPLATRGVEVINAWVGEGPVSALKCFPMLALAEILGPPPPPAPSRGGEGEEIRGLELTPADRLAPALAALGRRPAASIVIRTGGADVVTRRSAEWWRVRLGTVFATVVAAPAGPREARFMCAR